MAENEQDKSEQPTRAKLKKAREKGVVARGVDLGFFVALAVLSGYFWIAGSTVSGALSSAARRAWIGGLVLADSHYALLAASASLFVVVARPTILMVALVFLGVGLCEILQTGFVFSAQPLALDFSRLSPANGFKRVFSARALLETLKNILKLLVYTSVAFLVIRGALESDVGLISDASSLATRLEQCGIRMLAAALLAAGFFAVMDQIVVRMTFFNRMRMSRRELRRELRDREGEPRLRQRRKQLHREYTKAAQSLRNVRKADVLITNPQHVALGLRYDTKSMQAPIVVAAGVNRLAQRLKHLAFLYGVPIVEDRLLAQALCRKVSLNSTVPSEFYKPVAEIYNSIRRNKRDAVHV